jgi:parallel beta helix pectate lyase-like protein
MCTAKLGAAFATIVIVAACGEPITEPAHHASRLLPSLTAQPCPTPANVVVSDEAGLRAALAAATTGDVIGLNGFFGLSADVTIATPHVTLTCASPGSGIFAQPGAGVVTLFFVIASAVTVDRLVLDGGNVLADPYVAGQDAAGTPFFADSARLTNNDVTCGGPNGSCAFFVGTRLAVVADNRFTSAGSNTGVHMQGGIDETRIERNTIVTSAPSIAFGFGGIRVRDGGGVVVADNVVKGPWSNSIAVANLFGSRFQNNALNGAGVNGIRFNVGPPLVSGNVFQNNNVTGVGDAGIFAQWACNNTFLGNSLEGNGRIPSAIFNATTGANVLVLIGAKNLVIDNGGGFDCNGDGVGDPNIIAGPGRVVRGASVTSAAGAEGASTSRLR